MAAGSLDKCFTEDYDNTKDKWWHFLLKSSAPQPDLWKQHGPDHTLAGREDFYLDVSGLYMSTTTYRASMHLENILPFSFSSFDEE